MKETIYKGNTYSFIELLNLSRIEIPIIQRDYAQGRIDKTEIRQNFLVALKESILNLAPIKLDFIYGSKANGSFQPLDGQQRLTTLFLLHWYAACRNNSFDTSTRELLSKFTYETRISSREFCHALVNNQVTIDTAAEIISDKIIDSNWFFLTWKNDPTIDSMLRTIDDIHSSFFEIVNLWDLLGTKNHLISFYYVELEDIGLTDDLYIKMNARGKLLTSFENFKAGLQKQINTKGWQNDKPHIDKFSFKIDTSWTDYFWANFKKLNSIDTAHIRFIAATAMIRIAIEKSADRFQIISSLQDHPDYVKPAHFSKESFEYLSDCYDIYQKLETNGIDLSMDFPLWRHKPHKTLISEIVFEDGLYSQSQVNSASYSLKVLFYAQSVYLRRVSVFDRSQFLNWMRVVRNIVSRGDIDKDGKRPDIIRSPQTFDGAINLINELSEGCDNIYDHLFSLGSLKSTFAKNQIEEERIKARIIISKPGLKNLIWASEDNELLRGRIDFIFHCIDYNYDISCLNELLFFKIQTVLDKYFNDESIIPTNLRRAMLTIELNGKYEFYNYWWSFWNIGNSTKRRLFDKYRELEYFIYCDQKDYFKKLVLELVNNDFESIISKFQPPSTMPNWKVRLIKEPDLLTVTGRSNYIAIPEDESCCYLLKSKRPRDMDGSVKIL